MKFLKLTFLKFIFLQSVILSYTYAEYFEARYLWRYLLSSERSYFSHFSDFVNSYISSYQAFQIRFHRLGNRLIYTMGLGYGAYNLTGAGDMDLWGDTLFISSNGQDNIRKFTSNGEFVSYFGDRRSLYYIWGMGVNDRYIAFCAAGGVSYGGKSKAYIVDRFNPQVHYDYIQLPRWTKIARIDMDTSFIFAIVTNHPYSYNKKYGQIWVFKDNQWDLRYTVPDISNFYALKTDGEYLYTLQTNRRIAKYKILYPSGFLQYESSSYLPPNVIAEDITISESFPWIIVAGIEGQNLYLYLLDKNNFNLINRFLIGKRQTSPYFYTIHVECKYDTVFLKSTPTQLSLTYLNSIPDSTLDSLGITVLTQKLSGVSPIVEKFQISPIGINKILEFGEPYDEGRGFPVKVNFLPSFWAITNTYGILRLGVRKPSSEIYKVIYTNFQTTTASSKDWKKDSIFISTALTVPERGYRDGVVLIDTMGNILREFRPETYRAASGRLMDDSTYILIYSGGKRPGGAPILSKFYILRAKDFTVKKMVILGKFTGSIAYIGDSMLVCAYNPYKIENGRLIYKDTSEIRFYDLNGNLITRFGTVLTKLYYYTINVDKISFPWKIYVGMLGLGSVKPKKRLYVFEVNPHTWEWSKVDSFLDYGGVHSMWEWDKNFDDDYHNFPDSTDVPIPSVINGKVFITDVFNQTTKIYLPTIKMGTDDSLSLFANNNIHFKRNKFKNEFYVIYSSQRKVLFHTIYPDGMISPPEIIGEGYFPALTLDHEGNPVVIWYNPGTPQRNYRDAGLWFRRRVEPGVWLEPVQLMSWWVYWAAEPTSPPSMTITSHYTGNTIKDTVHILMNLYVRYNGRKNAIVEIAFPLDFTDPSDGTIRTIIDRPDLIPNRLEYPSIAYTEPLGVYPGILHAVWQHVDTIYYAYRWIGSNEWNVINLAKTEYLGDAVINSSHPFIKTEGDMVYIVWSRKEGINNLEEVYRISGQPWQNFNIWDRENISQTLTSHRSLYPVITDQQYTFYVEEIWPRPDGTRSDVFWRRNPDEPAHNISNDWEISSLYPDAVLRSTRLGTYLYVIWQEGNEPPYEIRFKRIFLPEPQPIPIFSYTGGQETPAPYLVSRDTFITDWQIPVDVGYENLKYQFYLKPGYEYKIRVVMYHEGGLEVFGGHHDSEEWKVKMKIDGRKAKMIEYEENEPETLDVWVPEPYYRDGKVEIIFERKKGDFVSLAGIYVYRFEYEEEEEDEEESGPQTLFNRKEISFILPTFIKGNKIELLNIPYKKPEIEIFDISGRKILKKEIKNNKNVYLNKTSGTYIMIIRDKKTGKSIKRKIIKLE